MAFRTQANFLAAAVLFETAGLEGGPSPWLEGKLDCRESTGPEDHALREGSNWPLWPERIIEHLLGGRNIRASGARERGFSHDGDF